VRPRPARSPGAANRLAVGQAIALATFSVLPGFLVGALAVGMRAELGFGPAQLGLAVAWFFITTALGAASLGKYVDRFGVRRGLTIGAIGSATSLLVIGLAPSYTLVLVGMTVGGLANALSQPAVNALLAERIPPQRLGFAFGIKQASSPAAMLLGGLAVPTLSLTVGWRGAFVVGAGLALVGSLIARTLGDGGGRPLQRRPRLRDSQADLGSLVIFAAGGMLGAAAGTSLGAFLVDAAVADGMTEAHAGLVFAATSIGGLISRPVFGAYLDRHPTRSRYSTIVLLLFVGAPGYLLLATGSTPLYVGGAILAFVAGWGWTGLFHYTVVSQNPTTPAASTGVIQTGLSLGAGAGPLALGLVAEHGSYAWAWVGAAALASLAGGCFWFGRVRFRRRLSAGVVPTGVPQVTTAVRWSDDRAAPWTDGVRWCEQEVDATRIVLFKLAPRSTLRARAATEPGVVVLLEGAHLELTMGVRRQVPQPGDAVSLPPNLLWTMRNGERGESLVAVVHGGDAASS
jgi:MFS family permease